MNMDSILTGMDSNIMLALLKRNAYSGILAISAMFLGMKLSLSHY